MPRLPKNIVKRGRKFYFRMEINGRQVKRSLGDNLAEAKRQAALIKQDLLDPEFIHEEGRLDDATVTVNELASRWLFDYVRQRRRTERKGRGEKLALQRLRDYVLPIIGDYPLRLVQTAELRAIRAHGEAEGLSVQTVKHVLSDVRCLLRYAVEAGELSQTPSFLKVMPKVVERAPNRLSDGQVGAILGTVRPEQALAVRLALGTGMRWGELRALRWRHVVWEPRAHLVLEGTKNGKVRRVPLSLELVELLQAEFRRTESLFVIDPAIKRPRQISRQGEALCGFHWHWHQLRHTFACHWLERGGSKETLQRILGHSTIKVTERYGALSDDAVFREAESLESRTTSRTTPVETEKENVLTSSAAT
jgi:integrase